jgi:putative membrane-bound dehydrogenase-like protein
MMNNLLQAMKTCLRLTIFLLSIATLKAGDPPLDPKDLPRVPPVELANVQKTFQIKNGFHLEIAAAEPLVMDPIAMAFDENGRLFVVEMRDYSEMRDVHPHLGRIRMLEDTNSDGVFDKATIYADDLPWPTGVICYDGGIFVTASPDIIYFKDTNGDGKADTRKVVFTGFGAGKGDKLNVQALVNSLVWGLDNRIHGQTAGNGGRVVLADQPNAKPIELSGRDFYFDPKTMEMGTESGGGQYGMCFDDRGRRFACGNSHHIMTFMYETRYGDRNPFYNMPAPLVDIPVDGPAAEVYRISPEEMWRVIRTKWRVSGVVPGLIEGGGRASGYFTSATGITIFRGNGWPKENLGDAFIADCGSNLMHRKKVRREGVNLVAERPPDEQKVEFLASTDLWFRPVQMANAPDGTLYLADMYREVIEHPWSLPQPIKRLLDLNAGNDRGRIYRIVPDGYKQPRLPQLSKASTRELVTTLEHPNGWHRDTAARLLYQRQDKSAGPALVNLVKKSKSSLARMHALYALDGIGSLKEQEIVEALNDADPTVREHAIKLSEKFFPAHVPSTKLLTKLTQLAKDPDITVRYQLALTLGEVNGSAKTEPLAVIARQDFNSPWSQAAVLSSLREGAGDLFAKFSADSEASNTEPGKAFSRQLAMLIGARNDPKEVAQVLEFLEKQSSLPQKFAMLGAFGEGLQRAGGRLPKNNPLVADAFAKAGGCAIDKNNPESMRVTCIRLLGLTSFADAGETLLSLVMLTEPQGIQLAALSSVARFDHPDIGPALIKRWETFTPRLRSEALAALLARTDRATALLEAIESGAIRASVLDTTQVKFLSNHPDKKVKELAIKVLAVHPAGTRQQVIDSFNSGLSLKGDSAHGHKIYQERCISCHRLGGEGYALGPDLVTVKNMGKEKLLVNILDPNREVRPEFVSYVVETKDADSLIGVVVTETATGVTLRQAYGKEDVIPRTNIRRMQSQGQSLMPEGLEAGLTPQDLADLIDYVETAN